MLEGAAAISGEGILPELGSAGAEPTITRGISYASHKYYCQRLFPEGSCWYVLFNLSTRSSVFLSEPLLRCCYRTSKWLSSSSISSKSTLFLDRLTFRIGRRRQQGSESDRQVRVHQTCAGASRVCVPRHFPHVIVWAIRHFGCSFAPFLRPRALPGFGLKS